MRLEDVQKWALAKFGRYSHEYEHYVPVVHSSEEWLGQLIRLLERHGEKLDLGSSERYLSRLKKNPQERIP